MTSSGKRPKFSGDCFDETGVLFDFDPEGIIPAAMKKVAVDLIGRLDTETIRRVLRMLRSA